MHTDVGPVSETRGAENADCADSDNKNSGISWVLIVMVGICHPPHEEEDTKTEYLGEINYGISRGCFVWMKGPWLIWIRHWCK